MPTIKKALLNSRKIWLKVRVLPEVLWRIGISRFSINIALSVISVPLW
jgi:hypothetical protein